MPKTQRYKKVQSLILFFFSVQFILVTLTVLLGKSTSWRGLLVLWCKVATGALFKTSCFGVCYCCGMSVVATLCTMSLQFRLSPIFCAGAVFRGTLIGVASLANYYLISQLQPPGFKYFNLFNCWWKPFFSFFFFFCLFQSLLVVYFKVIFVSFRLFILYSFFVYFFSYWIFLILII